jgi:hypothetical protein
MADLQSGIDAQSGSLDAESKQAGARQAALDARQSASLTAQDAEMKPLERQLSDTLNQPMPQREQVSMPSPPPNKPIIDAKEYEGLSYGLLAMAMVGGLASHGKWTAASAALNGGLQGYLEGNQEKAKQGIEQYEREFKAAKAHEDDVNKQFDDILKNRNLSINEQLQRIKVVAAQNGREDVRIAAEQRSIDTLTRQIDAHRTQLLGVEQRNDAVQERIGAARELHAASGGSGAGGDINSVAEAVATGRLDPRMLSVRGGWREKVLERAIQINPDYDSKNYASDAAFAISSMRTAGTQGANTAIASGAAQGGADILMKAAASVPRTSWRSLNKVILSGKTETNDPAVGAFNAALNTFVNEYARAINPKGTATVSDKEHAREILSASDSQQALAAKMDILLQEMQRGRQAPQDVARDLRNARLGAAPAGHHPADIDALVKKYGG